ncbi:MAG: PEP-utilizing enzyme, partial [Promethearchaeota archaeon]
GKTKFIYDDLPVDEAERIMEKGDVVATMVLFPEYFPALSKAGAIVGQQDTINCHVAILARELKIPCVVGINIKQLSRCVREGDLITVNGSKGKIYIPFPRCPETIFGETKELWGFEKSERYQRQQDILDKLIEFTKNDDPLALKQEISKAYELLFEIAPNDVNRAKSLYHDLSVFMQDVFVGILREKYKQEAILQAFSNIDRNLTPTNSIERLYFVIKNYINKHSSLKFKNKPFWKL